MLHFAVFANTVAAITGVSAAKPPSCCWEIAGRTSFLELTVSYSITGTVTSSSGTAAGRCFLWDYRIDQSEGDCDDVADPPFHAVSFDDDSDASSNLGSDPVSGSADITDEEMHNWEAMSAASFSMNATSGSFVSSAKSGSGTWSFFQMIDDECVAEGYDTVLALASAFSNGVGQWTFSGSHTFAVNVELDIDSNIVEPEECFEGACEAGSPPPAGMNKVQFFSVKRVRTATNVTQGVFAIDNDGNVTRLGFLANSEFDPSYNGDDFTVSGNKNLLSFIGSGSTWNLEVINDNFSQFDGDINGDGDVCWADRDAFEVALGSSINSANYTARADFDLDGDVDNSDLADFNDIGCTVDVDCSGGLTIFDYTGFNNKLNAQDPSADMNNDGNWNTFDYNEFTNTYNIGCP